MTWNYPQTTWISFTLYGITALSFVFIIGQTIWLTRRSHPA
ncbi:MAG: hypothetical protein FJ160_05120 [Gammaproteobacteria bacterium]|nr:hypothetical protein [Gammaproteobacteria bacterium]